ncbi:hypothetical protein DRQ18_06550 [bacterium]|nr:MAG: hypothetical protein DRQ18_06550 [bacterium]
MIHSQNPTQLLIMVMPFIFTRWMEGKENGYYQEQFVEFPPGVYFLKLKQEDNTITRKVIVIE